MPATAGDERNGGDLVAVCQRASQLPGLRGSAALATGAFGAALTELTRTLERVGATCIDAVVRCGLAERLGRDRSARGDEQLERLRRFCRAARRYEEHAEDPTLADVLVQVALSSGEGDDPVGPRADRRGVRAALPHRRAIERGELDEERRLAYVGITRTRFELTLSWPQRREGRLTSASRFLDEAGLAGQGARLAA